MASLTPHPQAEPKRRGVSASVPFGCDGVMEESISGEEDTARKFLFVGVVCMMT